jgi:hypothetical protein
VVVAARAAAQPLLLAAVAGLVAAEQPQELPQLLQLAELAARLTGLAQRQEQVPRHMRALVAQPARLPRRLAGRVI